MATVLITGGTGTIGKRLSELLLQKGYDIIILTRHLPKAKALSPKVSYAVWNVEHGEIDNEAIKKAISLLILPVPVWPTKDGPGTQNRNLTKPDQILLPPGKSLT